VRSIKLLLTDLGIEKIVSAVKHHDGSASICKRIITFKKVLKKFSCDKCSEHGELQKN
jgi:hypothetical protein